MVSVCSWTSHCVLRLSGRLCGYGRSFLLYIANGEQNQAAAFRSGGCLMTTEIIFITLSSLVIISYLLGILSRWTHIPSVLLLLAIGIAARQTLALPPFSTDLLNQFVRLLGAAGLVMIVLEASLDLRISKENARLVWNA